MSSRLGSCDIPPIKLSSIFRARQKGRFVHFLPCHSRTKQEEHRRTTATAKTTHTDKGSTGNKRFSFVYRPLSGESTSSDTLHPCNLFCLSSRVHRFAYLPVVRGFLPAMVLMNCSSGTPLTIQYLFSRRIIIAWTVSTFRLTANVLSLLVTITEVLIVLSCYGMLMEEFLTLPLSGYRIRECRSVLFLRNIKAAL